MKNETSWRPTRLVRRADGTFVVNRARTYGGSFHIAERQWKVYAPVLLGHVHGALLDVACGPVPYYEVYKPLVREIVCLDHPHGVHGVSHVDVLHDINEVNQLPFADRSFDTVLATDMLPQIKRPEVFFNELSRILKPGGKAIVSSTFVNWMGEYPNEYSHVSGPGLQALAKVANLEPLLIESFGGHADVFLDTVNKFFPTGMGNRLFRAFAWCVNASGWPERDRERTKNRYALGNIMVAQRPMI